MPLDSPFLKGDPGSPGMPGITSKCIMLLPPYASATSAATNLAASTFNAVGDPAYRYIADFRNCTKLRIQGRFGGTLVTATRLRIQYHTASDPNISSADAGWAILADSAGSHTAGTMFYSSEIAIPAGAQKNDCLIRMGIFGGDGAADPTVTCCVLNAYG